MNETIELILHCGTFAVVGASRNTAKYGHKVMVDLVAAGKTVYPVNPGATEIEGIQCYPSLDALPITPDAAVFIVPPEATATGLEQCARLGIRNVWLQPGSEPDNVAAMIDHLGLRGVYGGPCLLVLLRTHGMIVGSKNQ